MVREFLSALVDTGSDRTAIPRKTLREKLQLRSYTNKETDFTEGPPKKVPIYMVNVDVLADDGVTIVEQFTDLEVSESDLPVLGRDILRRFVLTLDEAGQSFTLTPRGAAIAPAPPSSPPASASPLTTPSP